MGTERDRLQAAYEATAYRVEVASGRCAVIRVAVATPEVDALLAAVGVETWAFVTAANPRSVRLSATENAARMSRLVASLRARGLVHLPGEGVADDPGWPPEPSLLVLGIAEHDAIAIAHEFDQHAIVVGRRGESARLAWVADAGAS